VSLLYFLGDFLLLYLHSSTKQCVYVVRMCCISCPSHHRPYRCCPCHYYTSCWRTKQYTCMTQHLAVAVLLVALPAKRLLVHSSRWYAFFLRAWMAFPSPFCQKFFTSCTPELPNPSGLGSQCCNIERSKKSSPSHELKP
jgi:hypothetical protein